MDKQKENRIREPENLRICRFCRVFLLALLLFLNLYLLFLTTEPVPGALPPSPAEQALAAVPLSGDADRTPPQILGAFDRTVQLYEPFSLTAGVSAADDRDGELPISVSLDRTDITGTGVYTVTYTASDLAGNRAEKSVRFFVYDGDRFCLPVENILQRPALPNGCEIVSLAIALGYAGYPVDPVWLSDNYLPKSSPENYDPFSVYIGDPKSESGGFGCYAPCLADAGTRYLADLGSNLTVQDISGRTLAEYEATVRGGTPVILWGTLGMCGDETVALTLPHGEESVVWRSASHCLVLIGFTESTCIFADPLVGIAEYPKDAVENSMEPVYRQACILQ